MLRKHIHLDSCAFNPGCPLEGEAAIEILNLEEQSKLHLAIAYTTESEINHQNTPAEVKKKAISLIHTILVDLISGEKRRLREIEITLAGNGKIENIRNDARNVFEAQKYHCDFVTVDERILKKRDALEKLCTIKIYRPTEFLSVIKSVTPSF